MQRLANQLASGVPTISLRSPVYVEAFGEYPGLLFARDFDELGRLARALSDNATLRRSVSDAGVEATRQFSRANITAQYRAAFCAASTARGELGRQGARDMCVSELVAPNASLGRAVREPRPAG